MVPTAAAFRDKFASRLDADSNMVGVQMLTFLRSCVRAAVESQGAWVRRARPS